MLGNRSDQINRLLVNSNYLLAAVNQRSREVDVLLENAPRSPSSSPGSSMNNPNSTTC